MDTIKSIVIIGAGNVATHLGLALNSASYQILQVFSRTENSARILAEKLNCSHTTKMEDLTPGADLYIFSVSDSALQGCIVNFPYQNSFIVHTSGSLPLDVLKVKGNLTGVIYPLQTFSKEVQLDFSNVPLCIEADQEINLQRLITLTSSISQDVRIMNSNQRELLHLAAVFACNFTNHMYTIAEEILQQGNIPFDILFPLIKETLRKATLNKPSQVQTGPAIRNDIEIISKHLHKLAQLPDYQKIYTFISESIKKSRVK